jgi:cell division protein FtsB
MERGMALGRALRQSVRATVMPVIFLSITCYFGWNATQGKRGLVAHAQKEDQLHQALADQAVATAERDAWDRRVADLRSNRLDRDTLDERARAMLNLADPTDVVVPYTQKDKLF